jgi:hypothetical protein
MLSDSQFQQIIYFLVFFKFVFLIFYTFNVYGYLFNRTVFENTEKWCILLENIFLILMGIVLLYRYNKDTIQVNKEERLLIWTLVFFLVVNGAIKASSVDYEFVV